MAQETLVSSSVIRLFGRLMADLTVTPVDDDGRGPLFDKIRVASADPAQALKLARVYGFSYQGNYYKMATPAVFLVHGDGEVVPSGFNPAGSHVALSQAGVEYFAQAFAGDVKTWTYDQFDFTVRLDLTPGWWQDVLLAAELGTDSNVTGGDTASGYDLVGRSQAVGRSDIVGRSQAVGRPRR